MTDLDKLDAIADNAEAFGSEDVIVTAATVRDLVAAAREPTREQLADAIAQTDTDHSWLPEGLDVETAADWLYAALHERYMPTAKAREQDELREAAEGLITAIDAARSSFGHMDPPAPYLVAAIEWVRAALHRKDGA